MSSGILAVSMTQTIYSCQHSTTEWGIRADDQYSYGTGEKYVECCLEQYFQAEAVYTACCLDLPLPLMNARFCKWYGQENLLIIPSCILLVLMLMFGFPKERGLSWMLDPKDSFFLAMQMEQRGTDSGILLPTRLLLTKMQSSMKIQCRKRS